MVRRREPPPAPSAPRPNVVSSRDSCGALSLRSPAPPRLAPRRVPSGGSMNSIAHAIQQFFAGAADSLTPFLAALSVVGGASMAIIQTVKDLFPLRT